MADIGLPELIEKYNDLLNSYNYALNARIRMAEYLHKQGMSYREIYAIFERQEDAELAG